MSQRWYYQILMEEFGPVTEEQLLHLIEDGTLSADDLVRPEHSAVWIPTGSLDDQCSPENCEPTDIADLSELSLRFDETSPTQRRTACSESEPPAVSSASWSESPEEPAFTAEEPNTEIYYCQSMGQTLGPMSLSELTGMAESGSLSDTDPVRTGLKGTWQPAGSISEISATLMLSDRGTTDGSAMSATTQKRLGAAAVASLHSASTAENPPAAESPEPAVTETPQPVASTNDTVSPDKKKVRKRKRKKGEEEILDEIFDDVFANDDEEKNVRHSASSQPLTATSSAAADTPKPTVSSEATGPSKPSSAISSYSSPSSSPAAHAQAAMTRARAASPSSRPSRGLSIDFDGPVKFVAIGVLAVAVIGGLIWQFGMPSFSLVGPDLAKYAGRMTLVVGNYRAFGEKPTPAEWEEFCLPLRSEFVVYFKQMMDSGASGGKSGICLDGIKAIISLSQSEPDQQENHKQLVSKIEHCVAELSENP